MVMEIISILTTSTATHKKRRCLYAINGGCFADAAPNNHVLIYCHVINTAIYINTVDNVKKSIRVSIISKHFYNMFQTKLFFKTLIRKSLLAISYTAGIVFENIY